MIHQLIFSGHVASKLSTVVEEASVKRIYNTCNMLGITGLMLYTDGLYLFIVEGPKNALDQLKNNYDQHERLSDLTVLFENELEHPEFSDFKICFRKTDAPTHWPECLTLNARTLNYALPKTVSETTEILARTFVRVNNFIAA